MLVIGLAGRMRSGKNTFAEYLNGMYGSHYNIRMFSFAKALKQEINEWYERYESWPQTFAAVHKQVPGGLPDWVVKEDSPDMTDPDSPYGKQRTLLQFWGVYRREQSVNYWVKQLAKQVLESRSDIALITDCRFLNEVRWIKSLGREGIIVKIVREGQVIDTANEHISEKALDGYEFDYTISSISVEELQTQADEFMELVENRERFPEGFIDFTQEGLEAVLRENNNEE